MENSKILPLFKLIEYYLIDKPELLKVEKLNSNLKSSLLNAFNKEHKLTEEVSHTHLPFFQKKNFKKKKKKN